MIHEFRRYRIKVGMASRYVEAFEQALPVIEDHMRLLAFWTSDIGPLSWVSHLWEFDDLANRAACYAAMRADPRYRDEFVPKALPFVEEMHSTILDPVSFSERLPLMRRRS